MQLTFDPMSWHSSILLLVLTANFFQACPFETVATHVGDIHSPSFLTLYGEAAHLKLKGIASLARLWIFEAAKVSRYLARPWLLGPQTKIC